MLRAIGGERTAILTPYMMRKYIEAEFRIMLFFIKLMCDIKMEQSHGNAFAQGIHDGATLANGRKYQALAISFVDPRWLRNLVVCVGFVFVLSSTNLVTAKIFEETLMLRTGFALTAICALMVSDAAAKGVANAAGMAEIETCDMHDGDKVGAAATGKKTRSRNGRVVNAFSEGRRVMGVAHRTAVYFNYSTRFSNLSMIAAKLGDSQAIVKLQADLNTTRIASEYNLLRSLLRMQRPLQIYQLENPGTIYISETDWQVRLPSPLKTQMPCLVLLS